MLQHEQMPATTKTTSAKPTAAAAATTPASHLSGHASDDEPLSEALAGGTGDALDDGLGGVFEEDGSGEMFEEEDGSGDVFDDDGSGEMLDDEGSGDVFDDDDDGSGEMLEEEGSMHRSWVSTHWARGWQQYESLLHAAYVASAPWPNAQHCASAAYSAMSQGQPSIAGANATSSACGRCVTVPVATSTVSESLAAAASAKSVTAVPSHPATWNVTKYCSAAAGAKLKSSQTRHCVPAAATRKRWLPSCRICEPASATNATVTSSAVLGVAAAWIGTVMFHLAAVCTSVESVLWNRLA